MLLLIWIQKQRDRADSTPHPFFMSNWFSMKLRCWTTFNRLLHQSFWVKDKSTSYAPSHQKELAFWEQGGLWLQFPFRSSCSHVSGGEQPCPWRSWLNSLTVKFEYNYVLPSNKGLSWKMRSWAVLSLYWQHREYLHSLKVLSLSPGLGSPCSQVTW